MAISQGPFTLISKTSLTHDVFELIFTTDIESGPLPGQYILFTLPSGIKRSYSISYFEAGKFHFIIKRLPYEWAGSREICDLEIGAAIHWMGPIGHFVLSDGDVPRLFIGTGTGFAPLYYQIRALETRGFTAKTAFVFGVRNNEDVFYESEFARLTQEYSAFEYTQYLSKGALPTAQPGYVTDALTLEYISLFQEFYICGSPVMVKDAREKLTELGIEKERIKFEQY